MNNSLKTPDLIKDKISKENVKKIIQIITIWNEFRDNPMKEVLVQSNVEKFHNEMNELKTMGLKIDDVLEIPLSWNVIDKVNNAVFNTFVKRLKVFYKMIERSKQNQREVQNFWLYVFGG